MNTRCNYLSTVYKGGYYITMGKLQATFQQSKVIHFLSSPLIGATYRIILCSKLRTFLVNKLCIDSEKITHV